MSVDMTERPRITMTIEEAVVLYAASQGDAGALAACRQDLFYKVSAPLAFMSFRAWVQWISMQGVQFEEAQAK